VHPFTLLKINVPRLVTTFVAVVAVGMLSTQAWGATFNSDLNTWNETATWTQFNSTMELVWANEGGDWLDANGDEQGSVPFSRINLIDDDQPGPVVVDVLSQIIATQKADFLIRRQGGINFVFHSREVEGSGPVLTINGNTIIEATADSNLDSTTVRALGKNNTLATSGPILIRFDLPNGVDITSATLTLESTGTEYGDQTLELYQSNSSIRTVSRPSWLSVDPTEVISFTGDDVFRDDLPITVQDGIATSQLSSPDLTWISSVKVIPNMTEGCATVYEKLGADFRPGDGGKLPGFSNTGTSVPGDDVVNGVTYPDTGWGGRPPDGIHWSARTGYGQWTDDHVASHTYFYAMDPNNLFGWVEPIGYPFPKGKWTAYVQCMKLNTVNGNLGNNDGKLYYEIAGVGPVYSREDIRWRDNIAPESEMREFWVNYYCGGTSCGDIQNRGSVSFAKAVLTRGLPDMDAVKAEVGRLNNTGGSGPAISSPSDGATLTSSTENFTWAANGIAVDEYWLYVGKGVNQYEYYNSGLVLGTSTQATNLPTNGETIYVRLWHRVNDGAWQSVDSTYTAATLSSPAISSPVDGSSISTSQVFTWTANDTNVGEWWLYAGSAPGQADIYNSGTLATATSGTITSLPSGSLVYVTLWYRAAGGTWQSARYSYSVQ